MTKRYATDFRKRIKHAIDACDGNVILRSDLNELGLPRQVSRALKDLVEDGVLIKLGYGVYAKARKSKYIDKPMLKGVFEGVCMEALDKLGVDWEPGTAIKNYNAGKTQQVPMRFIVRIKDRYRGKLSDGIQRMFVERRSYAK